VKERIQGKTLLNLGEGARADFSFGRGKKGGDKRRNSKRRERKPVQGEGVSTKKSNNGQLISTRFRRIVEEKDSQTNL